MDKIGYTVLFYFIYSLSTSVKVSFDLLHDQMYSRKQNCTHQQKIIRRWDVDLS